jgi:hypothetical protein
LETKTFLLLWESHKNILSPLPAKLSHGSINLMPENRPPHGKGQPVLDELQLVCGNFNMDLLADIIGMAGTSLVVGAFFLLQLSKVSPKGLTYNLMNLIGALFLLFSLCINFNLASFVIEVFWIVASVIGLLQYWKNKNAGQAA